MFTRLVLTNSDLLHLVTSTLDLEHREIEIMVTFPYFLLFQDSATNNNAWNSFNPSQWEVVTAKGYSRH